MQINELPFPFSQLRLTSFLPEHWFTKHGHGWAATTVTLIAAAAAAAGAGVAAYGQYQQGKAQERLLNYNARVRDEEAATQERDAKIRADQLRLANKKLMAKARTVQGTQGVLMAGSPLDVLADTAGQLEMSVQEVRRGGTIEGARLRREAIFDRMQGRAARRGANYAAAGTLLTGAGQAAGYAGR